MKARDITAMRSELMAYLFHRYGYTAPLIFGGYKHVYRFDD